MAVESWSVLIPVRDLASAKSRLSGRTDRKRLVAGMVSDVVSATRSAGVGRVVVVSDVDRPADWLLEPVDAVVAPGAGDLNGDLVAAARTQPGPVAVVMGDLPALDGAGVRLVLQRATTVAASVVADAEGSGTCILTSNDGSRLLARFGTGSFEAHQAVGAVDLTFLLDEAARRDIDTIDDLHELIASHPERLGRHTATAVVHELRAQRISVSSDYPATVLARPGPRVRQATVRVFDAATSAGSVLLDDGSEVAFGAAAFAAGRLRLLRPGQRVLIRDRDDVVDLVTLSTFAVPQDDEEGSA